MPLAPVGGGRGQHLVDLVVVVLEAHGGGRHVEAPHTGAAGADLVDRRVPVRPRGSRTQHRKVERVVLAQALHVAGLEPGALDRGHDVADLVQLAVGEHVALGEAPAQDVRCPTVVVLLARVVRTADAVVQEPPLRPQQRSAPREVAVELREAHVLEHADGADGVVRTVAHVAEVAVAHFDAIAEPALGGTLAREVGLRLRQRDAHRLHAVVLGCVQQHPAPTTPDVEQAHPGLQRELAADELVLVGLRVLEGGGVVVPHRARVGERGPEHHLVEVVRHVVVVRDRRGVTLARVAAAVKARLLRRRGQGLEAPPPDELGRGRDLPRPEVELLDVVGDGHDVEHVAVDLELAGDVGAAEAELVGRGHDPPEGIG